MLQAYGQASVTETDVQAYISTLWGSRHTLWFGNYGIPQYRPRPVPEKYPRAPDLTLYQMKMRHQGTSEYLMRMGKGVCWRLEPAFSIKDADELNFAKHGESRAGIIRRNTLMECEAFTMGKEAYKDRIKAHDEYKDADPRIKLKAQRRDRRNTEEMKASDRKRQRPRHPLFVRNLCQRQKG